MKQKDLCAVHVGEWVAGSTWAALNPAMVKPADRKARMKRRKLLLEAKMSTSGWVIAREGVWVGGGVGISNDETTFCACGCCTVRHALSHMRGMAVTRHNPPLQRSHYNKG